MGKPLQTVTLERVERKRGRGRPPKIPIEPTNDEVAQLMRNKERHLKANSLLQQLQANPDSMDVLDLAMVELAQEAGSLDFERTEAERKGKDTTTISSKKIGSIKAVIDTYLKKRETVVNATFDFRAKSFQLLFEFWAGKIQQSCEDVGMTDQMMRSFFTIMGGHFTDWEDEAKRYIQTGGSADSED